MSNRIVVIGASAGGVDALIRIVGGLSKDFHSAVVIVLHIARDAPSVLSDILSRASALRTVVARAGDLVRPGSIYVAPPDLHVVLHAGRIALNHGPREHGHRPAIDPLFRSAAHEVGADAIGVVLTGNLADGTLGLAAIKARGGRTIVQLPADAAYPAMPRSAIANVAVDHIVPAAAIAALLTRLCHDDGARRDAVRDN